MRRSATFDMEMSRECVRILMIRATRSGKATLAYRHRAAGATKNVLAGVMNASAVAVFVFSRDVHWTQVAITAVGGSLGGWFGALMLLRVNEKALRIGVTAIGVALTIGLFIRAP